MRLCGVPMLSERFRPQTLDQIIGQPIIPEILAACAEPDLFTYSGERWLLESDGVAGCGKTSAAWAIARQLGLLQEWDVTKVDSRDCSINQLRELADTLAMRGFGPTGRRAVIIDEVQDIGGACKRFLLGFLENLPRHSIVLATTTSTTWADDVDGLYSRWRRFRFRKPDAKQLAPYLERIAREASLPIPAGFRWDNYVSGKLAGTTAGNNIRDLIDQLPDVLRRSSAMVAA